jgi:hypothetical protein
MRKLLIFVLASACVISLTSAQTQPTGATKDSQIVVLLKEMAVLQGQTNSAQNAQAKAAAWFNLNRKADALAKRMTELLPRAEDSGPPTPTGDLNQIAEKSQALGMSIAYCEIGTDFAASFEGYQNYLQLWPDGPNADEAYWKAKVEANGCGDFEGTVEEYQQGIARYSEFLKCYPSSSYAVRAKSQLEAYQAGLREQQNQQVKPANPQN